MQARPPDRAPVEPAHGLGLPAVGRPDAVDRGARARAARARRRADRHGPRRGRGRERGWSPPADRSSPRTKPARRCGACRARWPRPGWPARCCRRTRSRAGSRAAPRRPRAGKRQSQPNSRRPARSAYRPAIDDEPPLADRDRAVVAAARTRHRDARRADHHPGHGRASRRCRSAWSRRCSTTRPISSATARRSTCWPDRAARAGRAPPRHEAASGSGRRAARPARSSIRWRCCSPRIRCAGTAGRSTSSAATSARPRSTARATGLYTQFEVQRGLGVTQMIRWFEESERWLARRRGAAPQVRFQVHNILEAAAASRPVRHRPVPQRPALPQRRQEARRRSTGWRRRWRPTAG